MPKGAVKPEAVDFNRIEFTKTINVNGSHLMVPCANAGRGRMHLAVYDGDNLVQTFNVVLPAENGPFWTAAYPLEHFGIDWGN